MCAPSEITPLSGPKAGQAAYYALLGLGALSLAGYVWVAFLSHDFPYGAPLNPPSTHAYIAIAMALGLVCAGLLWAVPRVPPSRNGLLFIFAIGLAARAMMFGSTPVMEDDWHRYLWDGAVVANGVDPYKYAPAEATPITRLGEEIGWSEVPDLAQLQELTEDHFEPYWRINYPYFKTIYPPIAQGAFAAGYFIAPFNLNGWRAVLLMVDLGAFALLMFTLSLYRRSPLWAGLYWWNPVVILEGFNAGHMDVLIVPFLIGAVALARLKRHHLAVIALAGASAVKLWPALLAPALVRPYLFKPIQLAGLAGLFCIVAAILLWPQLQYVFADPDQGLTAYSETWRRHAFLFTLLVEGPFAGFGEPDQAARSWVAGLTS
ncbi:MAG: hypothetical protein AAGK23_12210, partial [Pseudomonadota bacterium]